MSLRNRARALQKKTGLTYQQALARLRELGARPAKLARESGWPLEVCDRYLVDGHAPISVVEMKPILSRHDLLQHLRRAACDELRATSNARLVALHRDGRVLVATGEKGQGLELLLMGNWLRRQSACRPAVTPPEVMELDDGHVIHTTPVRTGVLLSVRFHRDESSLGLGRLRRIAERHRRTDELRR
ncbi:MAG: hypothetical protein JWM82_751 [Myxococcales bacterium]|nr:hypothetical protein [Myxococcales bacterium]